MLEEWELQQLRRPLPEDLRDALRASRTPRPSEVAFRISHELGLAHAAYDFFVRGGEHGGFTIGRA